MKRKQAKKKLKSAMARVCDVETVLGNLSLRLKKLEEVPVATVDSIAGNWATAVEKFRELEGRIQAHERKIEWLNNHQNAGDQAVSNLRDKVMERDRKTEALNKAVLRLNKDVTDLRDRKPLVEVFAKEKKA